MRLILSLLREIKLSLSCTSAHTESDMDAGKVAILGVVGALFMGVVIWIIYATIKTTPPPSPPIGIVPTTYKKDVIVHQYSLLPGFINGEYEAKFSVGAPHNIYPSHGSIKSSDTHINDSFKIEISPGMNIDYYMTRVSDGSKIFSVKYTIPNDIDKITGIYLCDGVIVDNRKFIPNFYFRFVGNWPANICDTMTLAWSSPVIKDVISDDSISCDSPPETLTTPYTFNSVYSPESVGWKGAWVGMIWTLYTSFDDGDVKFGSVTLTSSDLHVLVGIHNDGLKMSSS